MREPSVIQPSLFQKNGHHSTDLLAVSIQGSTTALSKGHKRFNKLVADIQAQRQLIAQWSGYASTYQQRVLTELEPLRKKLHLKMVDLTQLLDRSMTHSSLGKSHRAKIQDMLRTLLGQLLTESDDPELVRLHDKHSDMSWKDIQAEDVDFSQTMARALFGVEVEVDEAEDATFEAFAQKLNEKIQAQAQAQEQKAAERRSSRKKSAKTVAAEALRAQAAQAATQSLREVYRKLVSELHPDREADATRRDEKTALMKRVNQAYDASDLLALLELQLEIEQIDGQALAGMSEDRVNHFNAVLSGQLKQLKAELAERTEYFSMILGPRSRVLSPVAVQRAFDDDVRQLKQHLQGLDDDLKRFQDIKQLKNSLRDYRIERRDSFANMADLMFMDGDDDVF